MANDARNRQGLMQALQLAGQLGYLIALPLLVLALGGRVADRAFGTSPLFLFVGILCALFVSTIAITRASRTILRSATDAPNDRESTTPKDHTP